jgi:F0F1-type ATP synthase assembly protein I
MTKNNLQERIKNLKKQLESRNPSAAGSGYTLHAKVISDLIGGMIVGGAAGGVFDHTVGTTPIFTIFLVVFGFFIGLYMFYKETLGK